MDVFAINGENENHAIFGEGGAWRSALPTWPWVVGPECNDQHSEPGGRTDHPIATFYTGLGHVLEPDEMITHIRIPEVKANARQRFSQIQGEEGDRFRNGQCDIGPDTGGKHGRGCEDYFRRGITRAARGCEDENGPAG